MAGKFCVSLSCAKNDTDRATVAFVVANAALGTGQDTLVFLSTEGVRLAEQGYADDIHEEGFSALKDLMTSYLEAGGKIYACAPCFKKRGLDESKIVPGIVIAGGAKLVEFLATGAPCISY